MELQVTNQSFQTIGLVDDFNSIIWSERYSSAGDFEIYTPASEEKIALYQPDNYVLSSVSNKAMIIDETEITRDEEGVYMMTVRGLSLESLLSRRIAWMQTQYTGNRMQILGLLVDDTIVAPTNTNRRITNFVWSANNTLSNLGASTTMQFTGDNIYDVALEICEEMGWGFKVELTPTFGFSGQLYQGVDRSGDALPGAVIFSDENDNLAGTNYAMSTREFKTNALIGGEGEGSARRYVGQDAPSGSQSGVTRREVFIDARDVSSNDGEIGTTPYLNLLRERGLQKWPDYEFKENIEGEIVPDIFYTYGVDYGLGDIVRVEDRFGHAGSARVMEYIWASDEAGVRAYPTFKTI